MQTQSTIRSLLDQAGARPNKRYGQNFLVDGNLMRKLIDSAEITDKDVVLEVGCGTGSLTEDLARVAGEVVTVEIDRGLAGVARSRLADFANTRLIHTDALETKNRVDPAILDAVAEAKQRVGGRSLMVANLPYQVASPLMIDLLVDSPEIERMCITVQKEVGDRLVAAPGGKDYGPLSVIVQALAEVRKIAAVPPQAFWPRPAVDSVMLRIDPQPHFREAVGDLANFSAVVKGCFQHRRKTLSHSLSKGHGADPAAEVLEACGIDPRTRPEVLSPRQWVELARRLGR